MIELENITVTYGGSAVAVDNVSLDFADGDFTVLLGASGAGKSTLLRVMNGLVRPERGAMRLEGAPVRFTNGALRPLRRRMAMVFQHHQLIGRRSALANVMTGRLGYHGSLRTLLPLPDSERLIALQCLDRVGLREMALRRVDQLSGGQQQRVGIARALAQEPDFLLADEPVASLDPVSAENVLRLLRDICKSDGIPAIVSLHQLHLARSFADRVVGVHGGRVVFDGPPAHLEESVLTQIYGARGEEPAGAQNETPASAEVDDAEPAYRESIKMTG